ncbi:SPOR domain-containing protein [Vibrio palustris]|uniref:Cell division protein DedD n=1 Tax=Vibrio palustris TaxID=1918946 RepID=A0A1R4B1E2_9VIBR|nr:SPOR domain-containing protein [Vibrio palustris]SJL82736.1 cell division protein DedD [Vibrio palustris]
MASKFQCRLVGTIVLVAIGVIVLPDILDGKKSHYDDDVASIPIKPQVDDHSESFDVIEPEKDHTTLPDSPVKEVKSDRATADTKSDPSDKVATKIESTPEKNDYHDSAWLIQLMALKNTSNAKKVVADLQKRGYQAHTKQENGFTRVIIGPDVSKSKLERQIGELKEITGAKGRLLKFKPLNP